MMLPTSTNAEGTSANPAGRVVAHVDLDAFFTSVEQVLDPRLIGQPVVVGGAADQRGVVASASYEARARGVYVPMPLVRAYRACPEAHFLPGRHDVYQDFSRRVFAVIRRFSPCVEVASIDEGYLDWTVDQWRALNACGARAGHAGHAGHSRQSSTALPPAHWPLALAEALRSAVLAETGLSVSIGIGSNKLIAKIASKYCKPRGLCHVGAGAERAFLRPMRLSVVPGIGRRAAELLAANGFERFSEVQDAGEALLVRRLGAEWAQRLMRIAAGDGSSALSAREAPKGISNETTFSRNCTDFELVRRTLYRLVEKSAWRLRRAGLVAGTVTVKLRTADFRTRTHARALGYGSDCHAELYRVAAELFDAFAPRRQAVRLIGVQLSQLGPARGRQLLLFDGARRTTAERVDRALDRVRERWGFRTITTAAGLLAQEV